MKEGLVSRRANVDVQMPETPQIGTESLKVSRWRAARGSVVSFHQNTIALSDVVGEKELKTTTVGGRFPQDIGFREPQDLLDEIGQQILELESISQGR